MKRIPFFLALISIFLLSTISSCKKDTTDDNNNDDNNPAATTVTDGGGNVYNIVKIGNQYWTKENLKYNVTGSFCYDNNTANCDTYGRLYKFAAAQTVCPSGWRLPTDADFKTLEVYLGMTQADADLEGWDRGTTEGTKLKVGGGSGFEAKLGGFSNTQNLFGNITTDGYFWTSTTTTSTDAYDREVTAGAMVKRYFSNKENAYSVRCIKN